jgi:DNA primase
VPSYSKATIEAVKLRNPIEDVVRERVADLRRAGALWQACCPFHEERTPSFKVDPRKGTWYCYGACQIGGDQIKFVERAYNLEFVEALKLLASRAGVALPEEASNEPKVDRDPLYDVLARAESFFKGQLRRPIGSEALAYARGRGLTDATLEAFGIGFAPASGAALFEAATSSGVSPRDLVELGLARLDDSGRGRDFFRGRVMFPVRDIKGRTVGFGARRLSDDDTHGPKYINTPQTPLFHKGRVIYALDMALEHVRRSGHLILVEGYTDVMAAHQVGMRSVAAVLGTATTEDHAALVRRSGARRVSLLFDGDDAGRKATLRALEGLLPLEATIDIVRLKGVKDPCDLLVAEGRGPLEERLAHAEDWFEFLVEWVASLQGDARWKAIDQVLGLLWRLPRAIVRDERAAQLARALDVPSESVREQMNSLPERRRGEQMAARRAEAAREAASVERAAPAESLAAEEGEEPVSPLLERAWRGVLGAVLQAPSLARDASPFFARCPHGALREVADAIAQLELEQPGSFTLESVYATLGESLARDVVMPLVAEAGASDDLALELREHLAAVERWEVEQRLREARHGGADSAESGEEASEDERELRLLAELNAQRSQIVNQRRFAPANLGSQGMHGARSRA